MVAQSGVKVRQRLRATPTAVAAIALSPDGRYVAVGDSEGDIYVYPRRPHDLGVVATRPWFLLRGHTLAITDLAFPKPRTLLSSAHDEAVRTWDLRWPTVPETPQASNAAVLSALDTSGRRAFLSHAGAVVDREMPKRIDLAVPIGEISAATFDDQGQLITGTRGGHLHWWHVDGTVAAHTGGHKPVANHGFVTIAAASKSIGRRSTMKRLRSSSSPRTTRS